jgi:hypothetical protein
MFADVPFAIIERFPIGITEADVKEACIRATSGTHAMGGVLSLEQVGMERWPITAAGKVSKPELQRAALQYLKTQPEALTAYAFA